MFSVAHNRKSSLDKTNKKSEKKEKEKEKIKKEKEKSNIQPNKDSVKIHSAENIPSPKKEKSDSSANKNKEKSTTKNLPEENPKIKTVKLKLSVIRDPKKIEKNQINFSTSKPANLTNPQASNEQSNSMGNGKLTANSAKDLIKSGKNIFTTLPFVTYNTINAPYMKNLNEKNETKLSLPKFELKPNTTLELNKIINQNKNEIQSNVRGINLNNNVINKTLENNKKFNEHKNINININNINSSTKNEIGKNIQFSSPISKNTNNILINTNSNNVNNNWFNGTNNINININNNYPNNSNNIININNFCNGNGSLSNSPNNLLKNNNSNTNENLNLFSNNNPNSFAGLNHQLFQSLASVDYKDDKKKLKKKLKDIRIKHKRLSKEGSYNCGRWQPEEHERFIEAIMKFGNEWKEVQKYVGTRSSTQARSHAQKFFVKIKRANVLDFNIDLSKNSIKNLHEMANNLNTDDYLNAVKALNCVAFERKTNSSKRKSKKEDQNLFDSNLNLSEESDTKINLCDEIENNNINIPEDQNIMFGNSDMNLLNKMKSFLGGNSRLTRSNVKQIQSEYEGRRKNSLIYETNPQSISLGNSNNKGCLAVKQISSYNNLNLMKTENALLKKRHRLSSYEGFFGIEKENFGLGHKKSIDDNEIFNSFCKVNKFDFNEEEIENDLLNNNIPMFNPLSTTDFRPKEHVKRRSFRNKLPQGLDLLGNNNTFANKSKNENIESKREDEDSFLTFLM